MQIIIEKKLDYGSITSFLCDYFEIDPTQIDEFNSEKMIRSIKIELHNYKGDFKSLVYLYFNPKFKDQPNTELKQYSLALAIVEAFQTKILIDDGLLDPNSFFELNPYYKGTRKVFIKDSEEFINLNTT